MKNIFIMIFSTMVLTACFSQNSTPDENVIAEDEKSNEVTLEKHEIVVDENGYAPEKIKITDPNVKKVQLDFLRTTDATCATEVVYEPQKINVKLPINEKVSIVFDISKDNEITFGCHMDKMLKGVIVKSKSI